MTIASAMEQKISGNRISRDSDSRCSGTAGSGCLSSFRCEKCHIRNGEACPRRFCALFLVSRHCGSTGTIGGILAKIL